MLKAFGSNPAELAEAAKLFGGKRVNYGDMSVEIPALEGIPIVYILWANIRVSSIGKFALRRISKLFSGYRIPVRFRRTYNASPIESSVNSEGKEILKLLLVELKFKITWVNAQY